MRSLEEIENDYLDLLGKYSELVEAHSKHLVKSECLSQDYLKEVLDYDEKSGILLWKKKVARRVKIGDRAGCNAGKYRMITVKDKRYREHTVIWVYMTGRMPKGGVDHINGNGLDNSWGNHAIDLVA